MKDTKQVIVVRADLKMPVGKIAAQVAHASLAAVLPNLEDPKVKNWLENSFTKVVLRVDSEVELLTLHTTASNLLKIIHSEPILDSGRTVFNGVPTYTCMAIGPGYIEDIDLLTGHLKLL